MSLDMMGHIDSTFETGKVYITPPGGAYARGVFVGANATSTEHIATKQVANSEELKSLSTQGERHTDVARFFINDGSQHAIGCIVEDAHGKKYRIDNADCRPSRNYCKLVGPAIND